MGTLNQFRSRERVFASASARSEKSTDVRETEVGEEDHQQGQHRLILHGGVLLLCPCLQGHPCWFRCWRSVLLQGRLRCQGRLHLQGVQHGQSWIHGQGFLLPPLLDSTPTASAIFNY